MKQRGRPKGRSRDTRSFGPLGDLIRKHRLERQLGLLDAAQACGCSVQFISNIEHGRAPLPWDKVEQLAVYLGIPVDELQAANLAVRSDFRSFVKASHPSRAPRPSSRLGTSAVLAAGVSGTANVIAFTAKDPHLREVIQKYQLASLSDRRRFVKAALRML